MNQNNRQLTPEVEELLAEVAVFGAESLSAEEREQAQPWLTEVSDFEVIAATALQQGLSPAEDMPADVLSRLVANVEDEIDSSPSVSPTASEDAAVERPSSPAGGLPSWVPWLAAAACLVIGVTAGRFWPEPAAPEIGARMEQLLEQPGTIVSEWEAQSDPLSSGVTGRVVWNEELDEGYMTFVGLAPNDPKVEQYQLWVFDDARSAEIPVDGGVFDIVESTGEVIIPIRQNLSITKATLFAITVEKPGGVMKSDRSRLPLLAKVE